MKTHEWFTLFEKPIFGPVLYIDKFGCKASLYAYLYFNHIENYYIGTLVLPE